MTDTTNEQLSGPSGAGSVEVRRNVALAAAVGTLAGLLTLAFAVRTFAGHGGALDWLALGVMVLVTIAYAVTLVDSRAPLMVVDDRGVRLRDGARWRGIAWPEIECLEHLPRRAPFRDGHLLVVGYDDRQLVVPLTMATRVVGAPMSSLSDVLAGLAQGRADVVEVVPGLEGDDAPEAGFAPDEASTGPAIAPAVPLAEPAPIPPAVPLAAAETEDTTDLSPLVPATNEDDETGEIPQVPDEVVETDDRGESTESTEATESTEEIAAVQPALPGRTTILAARVDMVGSERPAPYVAPAPDPVDHGDSTVVLEELAVRPAPIPVIGPQLAVARQRLKLTIDQLSDRTRIRPHVIEAIEVDDFGPCGGDFYARGHLRTLCRVLGIDAGPLVTTYDNTYADAPVDPRRIFESELATGHGGSIRSTRGGRNWSVLISSVMAAVLIWSVAQLVLGGRAPIENVPQLNQSGGITHASTAKADPVKVVLNAAGGGAKLIVRDANGRVVLDGPLAFGQTANLSVVPPVRIWSSDGSVTVSIAGKPAKALGSTGEQASATFIAR